MAPDAMAAFKAATGVSGEVVVHATNEEIVTTLTASDDPGIDVAFVSGQFAQALGEFGVCPPYSETFGSEDLAEIQAFLADINVRPGGGTVVLTSGQYDGLGVVDIAKAEE